VSTAETDEPISARILGQVPWHQVANAAAPPTRRAVLREADAHRPPNRNEPGPIGQVSRPVVLICWRTNGTVADGRAANRDSLSSRAHCAFSVKLYRRCRLDCGTARQADATGKSAILPWSARLIRVDVTLFVTRQAVSCDGRVVPGADLIWAKTWSSAKVCIEHVCAIGG
jgi:hypothetical protein